MLIVLSGESSRRRRIVLEGRDQGLTLGLTEEGRTYTLGRGSDCDLPLTDADASRVHAHVVRRGALVTLCDLGAKNGTWLGDAQIQGLGEVVWRPALMVRVGRTVLGLEEPLGDALARIECAPDEPMTEAEAAAPPPAPLPSVRALPGGEREPAGVAPALVIAAPTLATRRSPRGGWSVTDHVVVVAALGVLALSIGGLVWLFRG